MSNPAKGPRLVLRRPRDRKPYWAILDTLDRRHEESSGCGEADRSGAEQALANYLARKHVVKVSRDERDPATIPIVDVIALYVPIAKTQARPKEVGARLNALIEFFQDRMLGELNGGLCREFAERRSTDSAARRALEDLRAAVNHHRREGLCSKIVEVVLPPKRPPRDRWLTRSEAATLILHAWRFRETQRGNPTGRRSRKHVAKFVLVALYTGTRASLVCGASFEPMPGRGYVDVENGVFYRKPRTAKVTKKRAPPIRLPDRLLTHLRRWKRLGQRFVVEFDGRPVKRVSKAYARTVKKALPSAQGVVVHTLRHTAATWMMQAGVDPWIAAGYLGMSPETLFNNYGHHHPDYQESARNAFQKLRTVGPTVGRLKVGKS